ncbi:UNVERIFIED_CONTAM: isopentenyl transferase family protein, partial [Klebsiella pneumoniae]
MEIYALYGTSGTGKSSSALELAHRMNIDAIIDDGILIYQGRKVAGTSAKYEKTKIQAVKRAIFHYDEHAEEVRRSLEQIQPGRLLILGTSQRMITRIVEALHLPASIEYIPIEAIKPPQEIEAAR